MVITDEQGNQVTDVINIMSCDVIVWMKPSYATCKDITFLPFFFNRECVLSKRLKNRL